MSTNNSAENRKREVIGCNVRKGMIPGGFSSVLGRGCDELSRSHKRKAGYEAVKEAARVDMAKRDAAQLPNDFDRTVTPTDITPCTPQSLSSSDSSPAPS